MRMNICASRKEKRDHAKAQSRKDSGARRFAIPSASISFFLCGFVMLFSEPVSAQESKPTAAPLFPFVLPWNDANPSVVSLADSRTTPAGRNGPIVVKEG